MTAYRESDSGLVVPIQPPKQPNQPFGPTEIQDAAKRELAIAAMSKLWDAMGLTASRSIMTPEAALGFFHYQLYRFVGEALLGADCPEKEILT